MFYLSFLVTAVYGLYHAYTLRHNPSEESAAKLRMAAFHLSAMVSRSWVITTTLYRHVGAGSLIGLLVLMPVVVETTHHGRVLCHLCRTLESLWLLPQICAGSRQSLSFLASLATKLGVLVELLPSRLLLLLLLSNWLVCAVDTICRCNN